METNNFIEVEEIQDSKNGVCRLCLMIIEDTQKKSLEGPLIEMLGMLSFNLDLTIIESPVICKMCIENIQHSEIRYICDTMKNITMIPNSNKTKAESSLIEKYNICQFCNKAIMENSSFLLEIQREELLKKYIPHLYTIKNADANNVPICQICLRSLNHFDEFNKKCQNTEEKIANYRLNHRTDGRQINIYSVLKYELENGSQKCNSPSLTGLTPIKEEIKDEMEFECLSVLKYELENGSQKCNSPSLTGLTLIKEEIKDEMEFKCLNTGSDNLDMLLKIPEQDNENETLLNLLHTGSNYTEQCCEIKSEVDEVCVYSSKKYPSRNSSHKKNKLKNFENTIQAALYKCRECTFETKSLKGLKRHGLTHKDPSQVKMFECQKCSFRTKYINSLINHRVIHQDPSKVKMFKCQECAYQTKHSRDLVTHSLTHKSDKQVKMYNCLNCSFQTKYSSSIRNHSLTHKDPAQIKMFTCPECPYQTKYSHNLKQHSLIHSELMMLKCELCPFVTKLLGSLRKHALTHKDPSQVTTFKCQD